MSAPDITLAEIRHLMLIVYILGLLTAAGTYLAARLLATWRDDQRRSRQLRIHRRTPFGI